MGKNAHSKTNAFRSSTEVDKKNVSQSSLFFSLGKNPEVITKSIFDNFTQKVFLKRIEDEDDNESENERTNTCTCGKKQSLN